ncbi:MAG: methyltransferase domain-containing protein [Chloroflexia bacterium]
MGRAVEIEADLGYIQEIRAYYDLSTPAYLKSVGTTIQSGLVEKGVVESAPNAEAARESNLYCASMAGIKPGDRVLDAGCGVCGPSIDIASAIDRVRIDGITLSFVQAKIGTGLVQEAGLAGAINVYIGDYHYLPFADGTYDVVLFLETAGYSYNMERLFSGVFNVLRPGGTLYIKDVFCREGELTLAERADLARFDRIYVYRTTTMSQLATVLATTGFTDIRTGDLGRHDGSYEDAGQVAVGNRFYKGMIETVGEKANLTEFGKLHAYNYSHLPIIFGEVLARRPATEGKGKEGRRAIQVI